MNGGNGPRAFWEREPGSTRRSMPSASPAAPARRPEPAGPWGTPATAPPPTDPLAPSGAPPPSEPPARVGGAVAALVVAVLTVVGPGLMIYLGFWFFLLAVNLPGIGFGVATLTKLPDPAEVERYIRYTWACTFIYVALFVVFVIPVAVLFMMVLFLSH